MRTFSIRIESFDEALAETARIWKDVQRGKKARPSTGIGFASYGDLHRTLTPKRLEIVRALVGQGPLSVRVVDRTDEGVSFPYDRIHFEFDVSAAA
jgi:predicted transcriptional regulator